MENAMVSHDGEDYAFCARVKEVIKQVCDGDDKFNRDVLGRMYNLDELRSMAVTVDGMERF